MSTLKVDTIQKADGTGSLSVPAESGTVVTTASPSLGRRNLIINGAMQVAQRGTSASSSTNGYNCVDRVYHTTATLGTHTHEQSTDAPDGFAYSYKVTCTTADATPAAGDYHRLNFKLEGQDLQPLAYGTSSAKDMTFSCWVKSNKTGSAVLNFRNLNSSSNRMLGELLTINTADTWEYKTFTISGDTAYSFENANTEELRIDIWLNAGSNYSAGTRNTSWSAQVGNEYYSDGTLNLGTATSDYFAITGVQLEVGSVATPFEHRSYGEELALCQRYYYETAYHARMSVDAKNTYLTSNWFGFPVFMRATPTISLSFPWTGANFNSGLLSKTTETGISVGITGNGNTAGYAACDVDFSADAEL